MKRKELLKNQNCGKHNKMESNHQRWSWFFIDDRTRPHTLSHTQWPTKMRQVHYHQNPSACSGSHNHHLSCGLARPLIETKFGASTIGDPSAPLHIEKNLWNNTTRKRPEERAGAEYHAPPLRITSTKSTKKKRDP